MEAWLEPADHGAGLLTGYYEPELRGTLAPGGAFRTPLRAAPPGLAPDAVLPRPRRHRGGRAGRARARRSLWVDDPVDAFFLQIQGSGRVRLAEGGVLRVGYAGRNGQPYVAIGRLLIERGAIAREAMSMQAIRAWLAAAAAGGGAGAAACQPLLRLLPPPRRAGAGGGADRHARRAADAGAVPRGGSGAMCRSARRCGSCTQDPVDGSPIRRLVLAQDTGGAIRGRARGDLFWGWGAAAEQRAGLMQDRAARVFVLQPRRMPPVAPTPAAAAGSAAAPAPLD